MVALCWLLLGGLVYFFVPEGWGNLAVFFGLLFWASFLTSGLVLRHRRRSLLTAVLIEVFFVMRYFGLGSILNLVLLAGLLVTVEVYLTRYRS